MEEKHRKAIQSNFKSLVETTDLDAVVTALYEKGVFSEQMIEPFRDNNESSRERKRKLYSEVTRRGPRAFQLLVETLSELGYWQLVRELDPNDPFSTFSTSSVLTNPIPSRESNARSSEKFVSLSRDKHKTKTEVQENNTSLPSSSENANTPPPSELDNETDIPDAPRLEVTKSIRFMEDNDNNDLKLYHTRGRKRGLLLLFSYVAFKNNLETYRHGVEVDCKTLKELFSEFGFRVLSYVNLSYEETVDTFKSLQNVLQPPDMESVFTVVSSHGYERTGTNDTDIRCSDGRLISFYTVMSYFSNLSLPQLIGIPKVFIFQVCRGSNEEYALSEAAPPPQMAMPEHEVQTDGAAARGPVRPAQVHKAPLYSDILIAHSTLPGSVSYRHFRLGSWYIQVLCEVFARRAHNTHVDKLFTLVDKRLREKFSIQTSSVDRWGFNKRLYLHPGLFE